MPPIAQTGIATAAATSRKRARPTTGRSGFVGGRYPGTGDFGEASRDPDPATNQTVVDGDGSPTRVVCEDEAARGSELTGLTLSNGGAIFRGGLVLKGVIATSSQ